MEETPGLNINDIDLDNSEEKFILAKEYLKFRVEYIFRDDKHEKNILGKSVTGQRRFVDLLLLNLELIMTRPFLEKR